MKKYLLIYGYEDKKRFGIYELIEMTKLMYVLKLIESNTRSMKIEWIVKKKWFVRGDRWEWKWSDDFEKLKERAMLEIL